jgi:hypothetical protein
MYVSAAVSVHFCCGPLWTSVAMASQWDVHKQQSGWSQGGDWSQSGWSDASTWGTDGQLSGNRQRLQSDKLQAMADAPPQFGLSASWTPSLRIEYEPVQLKPKGFVRTPAPQGDDIPTWMKDN